MSNPQPCEESETNMNSVHEKTSPSTAPKPPGIDRVIGDQAIELHAMAASLSVISDRCNYVDGQQAIIWGAATVLPRIARTLEDAADALERRQKKTPAAAEKPRTADLGNVDNRLAQIASQLELLEWALMGHLDESDLETFRIPLGAMTLLVREARAELAPETAVRQWAP